MPGAPQEFDPDELERWRSGLTILASRKPRDPDAVEEVVQETLARAIESLRSGGLSDRSSLGSYVRGIARHVIADLFRARTRTRRSRVSTDPDSFPDSDDPLETLISREERRRIRRGLSLLSEGDREILMLSFFEGLRLREIADRWDLSSQVIRKRKSRALQRLRELLLDRGEEDPGRP